MDPVSRPFFKSPSTAPIECYCQDSQPSYDSKWNELEEYWGAEKYRLQLEVQLQTLSSSLERQLLYEDCLQTPEVPETETQSKEPNYLHLSDSKYVVRGEEINDVPTSYVIKGIEEHEFPVIVEQVRIKIKYLRDQFVRELKKVLGGPKSGSGADGHYKPKWEHYNSLLFLKEACMQKTSLSNLHLPELGDLQSRSSSETFQYETLPETSDEEYENEGTEECHFVSTSIVDPLPRKKRRTEENIRIALLENAAASVNMPEENERINETFGTYLAQVLNTLDTKAQVMARSKLHEVLTDFMQHEQNK